MQLFLAWRMTNYSSHSLPSCLDNKSAGRGLAIDSSRKRMEMAHMNAIFLLGLASLVACAFAKENIKYGYSGENGPDKWGSLSSDYKLCSEGKQQSPIDIMKNQTVFNPKLQAPDRDYVKTKATLVNNGVTVELRYNAVAGNVNVDGRNYSLTNMQWHLPSEHTIDGQRFPMELQLIHKSNDGGIVVIAIIYQYGKNDAFLLQITNEINKLVQEKCTGEEEAQIPVGTVQTRSLKRRTRKYYRYAGSITAPPCTENVTWIILGKVRQMTEEQANSLKAPLSKEYQQNSRPVQPLNGRTVELFDEKHKKKSHREQPVAKESG